MRYNQNYRKRGLYILLLILSITACKMDEIAVVESTKDVKGVWRINKATRNGTDITAKFDFSVFRINFTENGTYEIQHPLPFIVSGGGGYTLNDPQYPFQIKFKEVEQSKEATSSFDYPIIEGKRNLLLTFSTGCASNTYIYTLVKDEN